MDENNPLNEVADLNDLMQKSFVSEMFYLQANRTRRRLRDDNKTPGRSQSVWQQLWRYSTPRLLQRVYKRGDVSLDVTSDIFHQTFFNECQIFFRLEPYSEFTNFLMENCEHSLLCRMLSLVQLNAEINSKSSGAIRIGNRDMIIDLGSLFSSIHRNSLYSQCKIQKYLSDLLDRRNPPSQEDLRLALSLFENLIHCTETVDSFSVDRLDLDSMEMNTADLSCTEVDSGSYTIDSIRAVIKIWYESNAVEGLSTNDSVAILSLVEGLYVLASLPVFRVLLAAVDGGTKSGHEITAENLTNFLNDCPDLVLRCYLLHQKIHNIRFIERVRWLLGERSSICSLVAMRGCNSWKEGLCWSLDHHCRVPVSVSRQLQEDIEAATVSYFTHALEGYYFEEALSSVFQLLNYDALSRDRAEEESRAIPDGSMETNAIPEYRQKWKECLRSLVYRACESGHLEWLCSLPDISNSEEHVISLIVQELELLACSTEIREIVVERMGNSDGKLVGDQLAYLRYERNQVNFYECLAAFLLSRLNYREAARAFIMHVDTGIEGKVAEFQSKTVQSPELLNAQAT